MRSGDENLLIVDKIMLKKVEVIVSNSEFINKINEWLGCDYRLLGGIINLIHELGHTIMLTDIDMSDLSFLCFDKFDEHIRVRLVKRIDDDIKRNIIITNDRGDINCNYEFDMDFSSIYLNSAVKNGEKKEFSSKRKIRSKK